MDILSIALIAVGLSMDAFAVSVSNGIIIKDLKMGHALKIGLYFGVFQALMPLAGWLAGSQFKDYIISIDHWIAFGLLAFIGGKMIHEAFEMKSEELNTEEGMCEVAISTQDTVCDNPLRMGRLLVLAIATSIDALAVGVSFAFLRVSIVWSAVLIGVITFGICFAGVYIGKRFGGMLKKKAEIVGGLILICIGVKILIEHLGLLYIS
ncbi:MAG TPA: manganese efflux pump MntP family protein [Clostridia bacterium]|nr:manganese efflux pump MntP family protein [Clostridia bacterium]